MIGVLFDMMSAHSSAANLMMWTGIIFSILCFIPLYIGPPLSAQNYGNDDQLIQYTESYLLRDAAVSAVMISVPTTIDTLIDCLTHFFCRYFSSDKQIKTHNKCNHQIEIVRLTALEKVFFLLGSFALGSILLPETTSLSPPLVVYYCTINFSGVNLMCPVLSFLSRHSTIFTHRICAIIALTYSIGVILCSYSYVFEVDSNEQRFYYLLSTVMVILSAAMFFVVTLIVIFKALSQKIPLLYRYYNGHRTIEIQQANSEKMDEGFKNMVIGAHILFLAILHSVDTVWWLGPAIYTYDGNFYGIMTFLTAGATLLVFNTEFRVKKDELTRASVS